MSADITDVERSADASPTIKVEIYDQAYTVRSDGDPEYLKDLAEYVDRMSGTLQLVKDDARTKKVATI